MNDGNFTTFWNIVKKYIYEKCVDCIFLKRYVIKYEMFVNDKSLLHIWMWYKHEYEQLITYQTWGTDAMVLRLFVCVYFTCYSFWLDGFEMRVWLMHKMHGAVCCTLWLVFISTSYTRSLSSKRTLTHKHTSAFWMHLTCFFHLLLSVLLFSSAFSIFCVFFLFFSFICVYSLFLFCYIISFTIYLWCHTILVFRILLHFRVFFVLLICNECHRCRF